MVLRAGVTAAAFEIIDEKRQRALRTRFAVSSCVDRLFDRARPPEDEQLAALAELELRLGRLQRGRRAALAAMALAGVLCWAATALALAGPLATAVPALFAACALPAGALHVVERRTRTRRHALLAQLPALMRQLVCSA